MSPTMLTYINEEFDVLANIIRRHRQSLEEVSRFASQKTLRRILILATGASSNAAFCARYFFERCGISIDIKEPYTFSQYENSDPQADMVIAISQSGKSASTLEAMRKVQAQGRPVFALTADPQSPLGKASDYPLDILTGIESVGFVTRGFSATVLNLLLIALLIARQQQRLTESQVEEYVGSFNVSRQPCRWLSCVRKRLFTSTRPFYETGRVLWRQATARWLGWQKSWKLNLPRRCVFPQAGLSWKPICTARIWKPMRNT